MHSTAVARLELESDLRRALGRDELLLHYQPIVRLDSRDLVGFEALLRWRHPEKGFIYPGDFIPVAEETGMILPIGRWVLEQACRQMREWRLRFPSLSHLSVSVNLSSRQLTRPDLVHDIEHALEVSSLAPEHLVIELTESVLMESGQTSTAVLDRLRELGIRIHLDDFGTGYSSLSYLHRLPLDALKIDRSFVARLDEPGENLEIVRTVLRLAQNLGMGVVAEGIETGDQLDRLRALGCPCGQGYYFSRPLDPAAVLPLLWGAARAGTGPRAALDETTGGGPAEVLPFQSLPAPGRAPTSGEAAAGDLPRQRTSRR
jgi:EAL domain-containing protein (putative c-di-GMP-specific phosphodiesterase class I)